MHVRVFFLDRREWITLCKDVVHKFCKVVLGYEDFHNLCIHGHNLKLLFIWK